MTKFAISKEGADAMRKLAKDMNSLEAYIATASSTLTTTVAGLGDGLGVFEDKIAEVVAQVNSAQKTGEAAIETLSSAIEGKASQIESLLGFGA